MGVLNHNTWSNGVVLPWLKNTCIETGQLCITGPRTGCFFQDDIDDVSPYFPGFQLSYLSWGLLQMNQWLWHTLNILVWLLQLHIKIGDTTWGNLRIKTQRPIGITTFSPFFIALDWCFRKKGPRSEPWAGPSDGKWKCWSEIHMF